MRDLLDKLSALENLEESNTPEIGDEFSISFSPDFEISTHIVEVLEDGIVVELDDTALEMLTNEGVRFFEGELVEGVAGPKSCWKGYRKTGTQPGTGKNAGKRVNDCEKIKEQGVAEGNSGAKYKIKSIGYDAKGDYYISPSTGKKVYKKGVKVGDHENPKTGEHKGVAESNVDEAKYQGREVQLGKKMAGDVKKSKVYVKNPQGNVVKVNFGDKKMRIKKSNPARRKSFRARHNCANPGPRHKARYWSCRSW